MSETVLEPREVAAEVVPDKALELNQSQFDALIQFSEQTDRVGKALDKIRIFIMARAMPGDWVQHGDSINLSGPGAERVVSALGLMGVDFKFENWEKAKEKGTDKNGEWFYWWYSADVSIGKLKLGRLEGRAGSRDKFFGYEKGSWLDLGDVRESDIRIAAHRGVFKEAVKLALGLRSIPASEASVLGLDPKKIKKVEYGGQGEKKVEATAARTPILIAKVNVFNGTNKTTKKPYTRYDVIDEKAAKYSTFDKKIAEAAEKFALNKTMVLIDWVEGPRGIDIVSIAPAEVSGEEADSE